ncbi:hypothetical protein [Streptomyces sp. NPDC098781]|uniref:hypothetical protein n=1 Tax=Streptomyces sp. NPDC098781 TaxID=3366097 RepID=UPI0037F174D5
MASQDRRYLPVWGATAAVCVVALAVVTPAKGSDDAVEVGRTCRTKLAPEFDISCGSYGFGDLRYACPTAAHVPDCPLTRALTIRNTGRSAVYVASISGPRQGVRKVSEERLLPPGERRTYRPGGDILFDITLRGTGSDPATLQVDAVE